MVDFNIQAVVYLCVAHKMRRSETTWKGLKWRTMPSEVTCAARLGSRLSKRSQLDKRRTRVVPQRQHKNNTMQPQNQKINLQPDFLDRKCCAQGCGHAASMWLVEPGHNRSLSILSLQGEWNKWLINGLSGLCRYVSSCLYLDTCLTVSRMTAALLTENALQGALLGSHWTDRRGKLRL